MTEALALVSAISITVCLWLIVHPLLDAALLALRRHRYECAREAERQAAGTADDQPTATGGTTA